VVQKPSGTARFDSIKDPRHSTNPFLLNLLYRKLERARGEFYTQLFNAGCQQGERIADVRGAASFLRAVATRKLCWKWRAAVDYTAAARKLK